MTDKELLEGVRQRIQYYRHWYMPGRIVPMSAMANVLAEVLDGIDPDKIDPGRTAREALHTDIWNSLPPKERWIGTNELASALITLGWRKP